jgi:hypothetical protein
MGLQGPNSLFRGKGDSARDPCGLAAYRRQTPPRAQIMDVLSYLSGDDSEADFGTWY